MGYLRIKLNVEIYNDDGSAPSQTSAALNVVLSVIFTGSRYSIPFSVGPVPSTVYLIGQSALMAVIATNAETPLKTPPVCSVVHCTDALVAAERAVVLSAHCTLTSL